MKNAAALAATLLLFWHPLSAVAGPEIYSCRVKARYTVTESGNLTLATKGTVAGTAAGMRFVVVRDTGRVQGDSPVGGYLEPEARLLARGNARNSFIATYVGEAGQGGVHFGAIRIEEYASTPTKPFVAMSGGFVYTGACE